MYISAPIDVHGTAAAFMKVGVHGVVQKQQQGDATLMRKLHFQVQYQWFDVTKKYFES